MLLTIFSTLSQPLFDDNENVTDTQVVSVSYIRSATDNQPLLDTFVAMLGKSFSDTVNETDNFNLNIGKSLSDNAVPRDTTALSLSVSFTDGSGLADVSTSIKHMSVTVLDGIGATDTVIKSRSVIFTDSEPLLETVSLNRSVLFIENGQSPNSIVFGGSLGFGVFTFGSSQIRGFISDAALPTREFIFNDNAKPTDILKTVRLVPQLKIEVAEAELRWDIG